MGRVKPQAFDMPKAYGEVVDCLTNQQTATLFKNIFNYLDGDELEEMDVLTKIAFIGIKIFLDDGHVYYGITEECVFNPNADRNTTEYKHFREAVLKRDGYKCRVCGDTHNLNVHHIKSYKDYPLERINVDNGITLCRKCHGKAHRK